MANELFDTNHPDYKVEIDESGWEPRYRLLHGESKTYWAGYDDALMLGSMIAVSPYHTDKDTWVMMELMEACQTICVGMDTSK